MDSYYTSVACNRTPFSASWGRNGLVLFGSCRAVSVYSAGDVNEGINVRYTLAAHKNRVNCVKWIKTIDAGPETEFVSGSTDRTAIVWQKTTGDQPDTPFSPQFVLDGHTNTVNAVDALHVTDSTGSDIRRTLVVTASSDSDVRVWERTANGDSFSCSQVISFGNGFALDVSICILPQINVPVLACGTDDHKVHLFVEKATQFTKVHTLPGHEDWVRGVEFTIADNGDSLLASCSQDFSIRIWRISPREQHQVGDQDISKLSVDEGIRLKQKTFSVTAFGKEQLYIVVLESVLQGHEGWVYGVHWQPATYTDGARHQPMCLLSASMDKTMILWKPDHETGVWLDEVRVGDVGGNSLGFYGCQFSPDGRAILAHGYQGALQIWSNSTTGGDWEPSVTPSGHFDSVEDIVWDPAGHYLLSCSKDQTTRLHAPWVRLGEQTVWYELARPQIHGYDMQCLAMIGPFKFASGGDEKVVRVFEAPRNFLDSLEGVCKVNVTNKEERLLAMPEGASVPALGLSNKAVFESEQQTANTNQSHRNDQYKEAYFKPTNSTSPPTEVNLLQNTLWPETQKLYGHGYEIFTLAADPKGTILASACKASKTEHAAIILWDVATWKQICGLPAHTLTVTQMAFSPDSQYLLSVSRDRTWALHQREPLGGNQFTCVAYTDKKTAIHTRIIWSCTWSHDSLYFATASRDKKLIIWGSKDTSNRSEYGPCSIPLELSCAITAVDFGPVAIHDGYLLMLGLEDGQIFLYGWYPSDEKPASNWTRLFAVNQSRAHHLAVKRVQFRRQLGRGGASEQKGTPPLLEAASCGADHVVKIYKINLETLSRHSSHTVKQV